MDRFTNSSPADQSAASATDSPAIARQLIDASAAIYVEQHRRGVAFLTWPAVSVAAIGPAAHKLFDNPPLDLSARAMTALQWLKQAFPNAEVEVSAMLEDVRESPHCAIALRCLLLAAFLELGKLTLAKASERDSTAIIDEMQRRFTARERAFGAA